MNHTEGKLKADGGLIKNQNGEMVAATIMIAATEGSQSSHEANTRRLVACWNACEGIPTDALNDDILNIQNKLAQKNSKVVAKYDGLRKAAEEVVKRYYLGEASGIEYNLNVLIEKLSAELNKRGQ